MKLRHAECVAAIGKLDTASSMVEQVYKDEPKAVNGYAAIAWRLRKNANILKSPWALAKRDIDKKRISTGFMLNVAELAIVEGFEKEAGKRVRQAYELNPRLKNGHARCAWTAFWPKKDYAKTIEWFWKDLTTEDTESTEGTAGAVGQQDIESVNQIKNQKSKIKNSPSRLSPNWRLNLALALSANGDIDAAIRHVEGAYAEDSTLKDGYARCARAAFGSKPEDRLNALRYFEKDHAAGRLSPGHMLNLAMLRAQNGEFDNAIPLVEDAYRMNPELKDGYARCAWQYFRERKEYGDLIQWMTRDELSGRLTARWSLNLALAYAMSGNLEEAELIVRLTYETDGDVKDGYARCAWHCFWARKDYVPLIERMERDLSLERLSVNWRHNLMQVYAANGNLIKARKQLKAVCAEKPDILDRYAKLAWHYYWPRKNMGKTISLMSEDDKDGLLSPRMRICLAQAHTTRGEEDQAIAHIERAYRECKRVTDGYSSLNPYGRIFS
jgi:tetratricopeptide (TPR) repeat protein